jgi:hypothetical protein
MCLMAKLTGSLGNLVAQAPNNIYKYLPNGQRDW